jgi:hypothetical protein
MRDGRFDTRLFNDNDARRGAIALRIGTAFYQHWQRAKAEAQHRETVGRLERDDVSGRLPGARLGDESDLIAGGFSTEMVGPYVGCWNGVPRFSSSDVSLIALGGSGSAKTGALASPITIGLAQGQKPESVVTISFKPDLAWTTYQGRSGLDGIQTRFFMPLSACWEETVRFNFFDDLIQRAKRGQNIGDRARANTSITFGEVRDSNKMNGWITAIAEEMSFMFLGHRCELEPEKATPAAMADVATMTRAEMLAELELLRQSPACDGLIADTANKFFDEFSASDDAASREYRWVMQEYRRAWGLFQKGSRARSQTERTNFDLAALKQRPQCLHIYIPPLYAVSHAPFIRLVLEYIIDTLAHAQGPVRVNLICDEFAQIPRLGNMLLALRVYREMGLRLILLLQDFEGFSKYKTDGRHKPFINNSINLIWGQRDADVLRNLESRAGQRARLIASSNAEHARDGDRAGISVAEHITSVLPGDAVQQINKGKLILDAPGTRLSILDRPMFWDLPFAAPYILNFRDHPIPDLFD